MHNLSHIVKTYTLSGAVAAGVDGAVVGLTEIDTQGYRGVRIKYKLGAIAAGGVFTSYLKNSDTAATYGAGTIDKIGSTIGNNADTDDNKWIIHDVAEPKRRFITAYYQRTVGNVTIEMVEVELYNPEEAPVTQSTDIEQIEILNSPVPSAT